MSRFKIILITGTILVVENIGLWYIANFYFRYQAHERIVASKVGQTDICKMLKISEDLSSVLRKVDRFYPTIASFSTDGTQLNFDSERSKGFATGAGMTLIFDQDYKMTHKFCEHVWEPGMPNY